jgi:uncharacterized protein YfbU (UPF0304 family)
MEELRKLAQEFKISLGDHFPKKLNDQVSEETKTEVIDFIKKFNSIISSIGRLDKKEDIKDFRSIYFKAIMFRNVAKNYYKIDVPDIINCENRISEDY